MEMPDTNIDQVIGQDTSNKNLKSTQGHIGGFILLTYQGLQSLTEMFRTHSYDHHRPPDTSLWESKSEIMANLRSRSRRGY